MLLQNTKQFEIWTGFKWSNHLTHKCKFFSYSNDSGVWMSGIHTFTVYMLYIKYLNAGYYHSRYVQKSIDGLALFVKL